MRRHNDIKNALSLSVADFIIAKYVDAVLNGLQLRRAA
jgi:hypothetical protein